MYRFRLNARSATVALAVAIAFLYGSPGLIAAELPKSPDVASSGKLTIANTLEFAPFEFTGENGQPQGINIELATETAKRLGVKLDIQRMPFPSMIPSLAAGRFRIAWETFAATPDRLKQVDFVMFVRSGEVASTTPEKAKTFGKENNLCGKRVGVIPGAVADFLADKLGEACKKAGLEPLTKFTFPQAKDMIQAVLSDRIDARLDDATASGYFESVSKGQLVVVDGIYEVAPLGIAIPKGDKDTADMLVAALNAMIKDGTYQKIMAKYGLTSAMLDEAYYVDSIDKLRN